METIPSGSSRSESGQYLVEFSLSFVVFMLFVFFVIDMGLMIYNHNVFYHGVFVGAREASLGADNETIQSTVVNEVVPNYFPTLFMRAHPDTGINIHPSDEIERVSGTTVTVEMNTTFGMTLIGLYTMTLEVPISSRALIVSENDEDRDGCKDKLEGPNQPCDGYRYFTSTFPQDHDNDGFQDQYIFNGSDPDADNDGIPIQDETVRVGFFQNTPSGSDVFAIQRSDTAAAGPGFTRGGDYWETWFDGGYHAPVLWHDDTQSTNQNFSRKLPRWHVDNSSDTVFKRTLFSAYDADNDGWEDKYDDAPYNPLKH